MNRTYIWRGRQPRMKELVLDECRSDAENGQAILAVPADTPGEVQMDVLTAVRRAYQAGREDRSAELIPGSEPIDFLRALVREEAISSIAEWGTGWTDPVDGNRPRQHYITLEDIDGASHVISVAVGEVHYDPPLKRFRIQVLVEEVTPR